MNTLDKQYTDLLQDILENGVKKETRNGGTISVFGRQIRHNMKDGFPLLTTKKMAFKTMVTELLWFLRGDTSIEYLLENDCNIWTGDAYKNYLKHTISGVEGGLDRIAGYMDGCLVEFDGHYEHFSTNPSFAYGFRPYTQEEFINKIKTDDEFAKKWGELGPIYGKQWREWSNYRRVDSVDEVWSDYRKEDPIDQISNLINDLKTNPDSRRLMVNAWNVGELDQMVLPPCHYGFQVYTRELSDEERLSWMKKNKSNVVLPMREPNVEFSMDEWFRPYGVPKRAISLMWNQRSCDVPLGIPMNIASYALLLTMIADEVNMVPDELIGNLGDCHIYLNQMDGVKEQIGRDLTLEERRAMVTQEMFNQIYTGGSPESLSHSEIDQWDIPKRTREPYPLPKVSVRDGIHCSSVNDIILENYQSHPKIYFPLSN